MWTTRRSFGYLCKTERSRLRHSRALRRDEDRQRANRSDRWLSPRHGRKPLVSRTNRHTENHRRPPRKASFPLQRCNVRHDLALERRQAVSCAFGMGLALRLNNGTFDETRSRRQRHRPQHCRLHVLPRASCWQACSSTSRLQRSRQARELHASLRTCRPIDREGSDRFPAFEMARRRRSKQHLKSFHTAPTCLSR